MKRLTKRNSVGTIGANELRYYNYNNFQKIVQKLSEYEDFEEIFREKMTDTACEFLKDKEEFGKWLDRNKWITKKCDEWVRAEEQGLLLRLPCKVGDTVWRIIISDNYIMPCNVEEFVYSNSLYIAVREELFNTRRGLNINEIGKTVFLTRAEAEQKLKEMESD